MTEELPLFRQTNPKGFWYDETLWPENTEFFYLDTPNDWLEPLNAAARAAKDAWCDEQDELHRKYCEKMNRPFTPRPRDWREGVDMMRADAVTAREAKDAGPAARKLISTKRDPVPAQAHLGKKKPASTKMSGVKLPPAIPSPETKPIGILGANFNEMLPTRG